MYGHESTINWPEKNFTLEIKKDFNDILPGQYIWFSKEGNIGQYRVVDADKEHNKLTYTDGHGLTKEINFDYNKPRNYEFFASLQDATYDAMNYVNTYFDIQNPGTPNARVVYKSPEKIYQQNIQQMLLD